VNALAAAGVDKMPGVTETLTWIASQQFTERHPFTGSDPGGWGWTHLPGSVPDGDDTPGALLALAQVAANQLEFFMPRISAGIYWLASLQNRDGGWPTFCRGWGRLPFDRSGPGLTAHALRAPSAWSQRLRGSKYWHDTQCAAGTRTGRAIICIRLLSMSEPYPGAWNFSSGSSGPMAPGFRSGLAINTPPPTKTRPTAPPVFWPRIATSI